jgi:hypothetical protein
MLVSNNANPSSPSTLKQLLDSSSESRDPISTPSGGMDASPNLLSLHGCFPQSGMALTGISPSDTLINKGQSATHLSSIDEDMSAEDLTQVIHEQLEQWAHFNGESSLLDDFAMASPEES